jgi:hypothetical protein
MEISSLKQDAMAALSLAITYNDEQGGVNLRRSTMPRRPKCRRTVNFAERDKQE